WAPFASGSACFLGLVCSTFTTASPPHSGSDSASTYLLPSGGSVPHQTRPASEDLDWPDDRQPHCPRPRAREPVRAGEPVALARGDCRWRPSPSTWTLV